MPSQQSSHRRRRQPARQIGQKSPQQRRSDQRSALQQVDYSVEYAYIRLDLKRIAIWSILLFVGMFAVSFFI